MRFIYSYLFYLVIPLIRLYLKKRAKKNPDYLLFWNERFGQNLVNISKKPIIWIHAVSVGETRAMIKLIKLIEDNYPNYQVLITQMTPTGRKIAGELYPNAILHYIPYDTPRYIKNFYKTFKPKIGLIMETEIWPNVIHYAYKFSIPLFLVNARLSNKSYQSYNKVRWIFAPIINKFTSILCQDQKTYDNFKKLAYKKNMQIIGNTKFDMLIDNSQFKMKHHFLKNILGRKVVIFASTRIDEEELIVNNLTFNEDYLIIIVPRHPERFSEVEQLLIDKKISYQKRSEKLVIEEKTRVFIGDSLGEMMGYYSMSDLAVIGGSFNDFGGQNLIEPLYLDIPVIFGKSMYNFSSVAKNAIQYNCAIQVSSMADCLEKINYLLTNENDYKELKKNCKNFIDKYQGASKKILDAIKSYL